MGGPSKLPRERIETILTFLGIDSKLPTLGPPGLASAFQKWKAIEGALNTILALKKNEEWKALVDDDPWTIIFPDFVDIFVAKSQFYKVWRPKFTRANTFPEMVDWLNDVDDCLSNDQLWGPGHDKTLTFTHLENWLTIKERESKRKGKEKATRVSKSPPKGKKRDDRDISGEQKRKHKKMTDKEKKDKALAKIRARARADSEEDEDFSE